MTGERSVVGLYCMIFGLYWQIKIKRADRLKGVLLYAITVNFILCTAFFILTIIETQFNITVSHIHMYILWAAFSWFSNSQEAVLDIDSLDSALYRITIAANALYTAVDFISQLILVSVLKNTILCRVIFFPFRNEALPMLDLVAPTVGHGYPVHFITWVFRC